MTLSVKIDLLFLQEAGFQYDAATLDFAVKHDREQAFNQATLKNRICAVVAVGIILAAIYGYRNDIWNETLDKKLQFSQEPRWSIFDFRIFQDKTKSCSM